MATTQNIPQLVIDGIAPTRMILTRHGYLPNDQEAMNRCWEGFSCSNGMRECMSKEDFKSWWAEQIAKAYDEYVKNE